MLDHDTITHLESGAALVVGTVSTDRAPRAGRGWALKVVTTSPPVVRVLVDLDDDVTVENLRTTGTVAITSADVESLESFQLKGRVLDLGPATPDDVDRGEHQREALFAAIHETDGTPLEILRAWGRRQVLACTVEVEGIYDQTPGPAAGAAVPSTTGRGDDA